MNRFITLVTLLLLASLNAAHAQWVEATGSAQIINDNKDSARNLAVQDALKQALLFSGAQVKSVAQMSNGLLTSDRFEVQSQGSVRSLQLISETQSDTQITLTIRADIINQETQCPTGNTRNTIAITKFPIRHRQQAVRGSIFDIGKQTAHQLFSVLNDHQGTYKATRLLEVEQAVSNQALTKNQFPTPVQVLTQHADTQYLLTGEITDLSMHQPKSKWYGLSSHTPKRQFGLRVALFDGNSSEQVWSKSYTAQGDWPHSKTQLVDVNSDEFWTSDYGNAIQAQLLTISSDLNQALYCAELTAPIVRVDNQAVTVNLGSNHGIKSGDKFSVYHNTQFIDNNGISRQSLVINSTTLLATQVNRSHTVLTPQSGTNYGDINLNDIVKKQ